MKTEKMRLNPSVKNIDNALSININQIVYNLKRSDLKVLTLSLGEGFFDVPLYDFSVLDNQKIFHYSDTQGLPGLRKKIANHYNRRHDSEVDPDWVVITAGSKAAIFFACMALLDKDDEALIMEPAWLSYPAHVQMAKAKPIYVPYKSPVDSLEKYFTEKTRMFIACSPNNPGGFLYSKTELVEMYKLCQKHGVVFLMDEAYSDFVGEDKFVSLASISKNMKGSIVVNSFSKNFGMSGWRIGYAILDPLLVPTIVKLNQHIITCAPTILTQYVEYYFDDLVLNCLPLVKDMVKKRKLIKSEMDRLEVDHLDGSATFYFFVSIGNYKGSSVEFALDLLLNHRIAVIPGSAYGKTTDRYVRLSIGTESLDDIFKGLITIRKLQKSNKTTKEDLAELVNDCDAINEADTEYFTGILLGQ